MGRRVRQDERCRRRVLSSATRHERGRCSCRLLGRGVREGWTDREERSACEDLFAYQFAHAQHVEDLGHGGCEGAHVQPDTTLLHVEAEADKKAGA